MLITTVSATLPHPPGINATYRSGRGRWYKTARARQWQQDALLLLRAAGIRTLPAGSYWLALALTLCTVRLDADAPLKLVIDTVAEALGIDDRCVGLFVVRKLPVRSRAAQRLHVGLCLHAVDGVGQFTTLSRTWSVVDLAEPTP